MKRADTTRSRRVITKEEYEREDSWMDKEKAGMEVAGIRNWIRVAVDRN